MKQLFLFISIFLFQTSFGQFKVDSTIKTQYWKVFERLPEKFKDGQDIYFEGGMGLLIGIKTDTLNKYDLQTEETSIKIYNINLETGESEPLTKSPSEEETINENEPMWLSCECNFKGNTLEIGAGISLFSGFVVTTRISKDKAKAVYHEFETEGKVFKTKLENKKVSEFTIPAIINSISLDREPKKGISEIYGKMDVTTNGYYSFVNSWGFKHEYIHKRMQLQFYFKCETSK